MGSSEGNKRCRIRMQERGTGVNERFLFCGSEIVAIIFACVMIINIFHKYLLRVKHSIKYSIHTSLFL